MVKHKVGNPRVFCAAREHVLKLCHIEINTKRLTRRKGDGVLKKKVITHSLDQRFPTRGARTPWRCEAAR